jgi:hypothetical protein
VLEADGVGDEVYQAPFVVVAERSGATRVSVGGTGPIFRGIRTGASFPTATPHILSSSPIGLGFPGVLFEGELIEGEKAVAIAPTLWEWDGPDRQLRAFFGACAASTDRVAAAVIARMTGTLSDRLRGLISPRGGPIIVPLAAEGDLDRPIGIQVALDGSSASFRPEFQLFTYERAVQDSLFGTVTTFNFVDPDSHQGAYLLHVIVERLP